MFRNQEVVEAGSKAEYLERGPEPAAYWLKELLGVSEAAV
jgi:hypothetical protein